MNEANLKLLDKQGYHVIDEDDFFILKRKLVKSRAKLIVFFPLSAPFFFLSLWMMAQTEFSLSLSFFIIGMILFSIPFWEYLISPFFSFYIDKNLRTVLFRAKHSRAYKFSEITKITLEVSSRYSDTHAFSDSNKEYDYRMNVYFGNSKEEIFKIVERDEKSEAIIVEIKDFFEKLLE